MEFFTNPWVIAIGTGLIVGLILYFVFGIGKPKSRRRQQTTQQIIEPTIQSTTQPTTTIHNKNHSTSLQVPVEGATNDITPEDIRNYLASLPPLQQDSAAKNYKEISVSWTVNLQSGTIHSDGNFYLIMSYKGRHLVSCEIDPGQYPILRVIKKTQLFTVEGEIEEVALLEIKLKNCRFLF